jgi:hypothetical protein
LIISWIAWTASLGKLTVSDDPCHESPRPPEREP